MCRLCMLDRTSVEWLYLESEEDRLTPFLKQLEKSQGGDGNGVAALHKRGRVSWLKGTALHVRACTAWILQEYLDGAQYFMFHTRRASLGTINTDNCHPFVTGKTCLAHNGHDSELITVAEKELKYDAQGYPDSRAALFLLDEYGPDCLKKFSGNFMGFHKGKPFLTLGIGYWSMQEIECVVGRKKGRIWASERPLGIRYDCYNARNLRPDEYVPPALDKYEQAWVNRLSAQHAAPIRDAFQIRTPNGIQHWECSADGLYNMVRLEPYTEE